LISAINGIIFSAIGTDNLTVCLIIERKVLSVDSIALADEQTN